MKIHENLEQGTDEWLQARCGLITASEAKLLITPTLKAANNDKSRAHLWELLAQRITGYVEPQYVSDDMLRGQEDEIVARDLYSDNYAPVTEVGFITEDKWGYTIGYSPDGLVGDEGTIEVKSRRQKFQIETIITQIMPIEYMPQIQTGLLVTGRKWCDFISYCGGLPMVTIRVEADEEYQAALLDTFEAAEGTLLANEMMYRATNGRLIPTERTERGEII